MSFIQRCKEGAQLEELTRQDDRFYLENARLRSQIRIKEGRAKPIDLLAQYIRYFHEPDVNESVALNEPCFYVDNLQLDDLEDLEVDIPVYIKLENGQNSDFWNNLIVLVQHRINELKKYQGRGSLVQRSGKWLILIQDNCDIFYHICTVFLKLAYTWFYDSPNDTLKFWNQLVH